MKNKILLVLSILFGLMFINSGLNKLFEYIPIPEDMPADVLTFMANMEAMGWLIPLLAAVEIIGGVMFMTNRYRALGAIVIFPIMVGILLAHIVNLPAGLPIAIVLMGINLWVIYENRARYMPMIR